MRHPFYTRVPEFPQAFFPEKQQLNLAGTLHNTRRSEFPSNSALISMDRLWRLICDRKRSGYSPLSVASPDNRKQQKALLKDVHYVCFILPVCQLIFWMQPSWCGLWHWINTWGRERPRKLKKKKKKLNGVYFSILIMSSSLRPSSHVPSSYLGFSSLVSTLSLHALCVSLLHICALQCRSERSCTYNAGLLQWQLCYSTSLAPHRHSLFTDLH